MITDGKTITENFLVRYWNRTDIKYETKKDFVETIKDNIRSIDYKQTTKDFIYNIKDTYKKLENYKHFQNYGTINDMKKNTFNFEKKMSRRTRWVGYFFAGIFIYAFGSNLPYAYVMHQNNKMLHQNNLKIQQ